MMTVDRNTRYDNDLIAFSKRFEEFYNNDSKSVSGAKRNAKDVGDFFDRLPDNIKEFEINAKGISLNVTKMTWGDFRQAVLNGKLTSL